MEDVYVHEVAIVGAGFGGLGMAIRLKHEGIEDFVLIERGDDVGGTWWANSYILYVLESQIPTRWTRCEPCASAARPSSRCAPRSRRPTTRSCRSASPRRVWNTGGCGSWSFDRNGGNSIQWPGFTCEYRGRTQRFDAESYRLAPALVAGRSDAVAPAIAT